jgi:hypothetical protein
MQIWLRHPHHGEKCAYIEAEAVNDEKNGWKRFDVDAKPASTPEAEGVQVPVITQAEPITMRKKPGRKPKNKG